MNNHVALELGERQHDITDEPARRRVVDDAHVENVDDDTFCVEALDEMNAVYDTPSDSIDLSDNKFVAGLNDYQEFVELRVRVLRVAEHVGENFNSPRVFKSVNLSVKRIAITSLTICADASIAETKRDTCLMSKRNE